MANFQGLGDILGNMSRQVFNSAMSAATNSVNRAADPWTVQEISGSSNINEVADYPVLSRANPLLLHGPVDPGRFITRPPAFHIILHVPNSKRMFSMMRTDNRKEADETFVLYKESLPLLVNLDVGVCDTSKLDQMARKLRSNPGWTAPHLAASSGLLACLRNDLMKAKLNDQEGRLLRTPLLVAIEEGNLAAVATLLELGVDVGISDLKGNSVFHVAASKNCPLVFKLLMEKLPLSQHCLLNAINSDGFTPLHCACKNNNSEILKTLLSAGADPTVSSLSQGYPIHVAVKASSVSCMQELITNNPTHLQSKDLQEGGSPLHWAAGPETLIPLLDLGCDPNTQDESGETPLHHAVRRGCVQSTLYLLCHGAFPDIKGGEMEDTPLHIGSRLCSRLVMQALIVFGSDINMQNKSGDTPRHLVSTSLRSDKDEVLHILTAVGAKRCSQLKEESCVSGCKYSGTFEGKPPLNFPSHGAVNLMHEALNAAGVQKAARDRRTSIAYAAAADAACQASSTEEIPSSSTTSTHADLNRNIGTGGGMDNYKEAGGRLLCLDGGGIRGIVLTQILAVIEQELKVPIIELFDWVAGTSTGGILALALACGKSPLETQCIYMRLKDKVFVGERPYSADVMEDFLKKEFGSTRTMGSILKPRVMIMTALVDRRPVDLHLFRNYMSPLTMIGEQDTCVQDYSTQHVWEVAKVTGAAPSYFRLNHDKFIDGGLIANNPTLDAMVELQQFRTSMKSLGYFRNEEKIPTTVVSIGTGIPPRTASSASAIDITWPSGIFDTITKVPRLASLVNLLIDQATQSEGQVVERGRAWCSAIGIPFFRFSPQMTEDVGLDEKTNEKLIQLLWETRCYMIANRDVILDMKQILMEQSPPPSPMEM